MFPRPDHPNATDGCPSPTTLLWYASQIRPLSHLNPSRLTGIQHMYSFHVADLHTPGAQHHYTHLHGCLAGNVAESPVELLCVPIPLLAFPC